MILGSLFIIIGIYLSVIIYKQPNLKRRLLLKIVAAFLIIISFVSVLPKENTTAKKTSTPTITQQQVKKLEQKNNNKQKSLKKSESALALSESALKVKEDVQAAKTTTESSPEKELPAAAATPTPQTASSPDLANLDYATEQVIEINQNQPNFSAEELDLSKGAWQTYGDLDTFNRPTDASAMLNSSLMPTAKRESLTVNPTGWHNKRIASGWLYNRSHLIGYQLTGQNNNWKNLITGTRSLNSPGMLKYEMDVAYYLKQNASHYVRYQVKPIFRGNELLARGVQMRAQSVENKELNFNVYIFNIEKGVTLNYADGTSQIVS